MYIKHYHSVTSSDQLLTGQQQREKHVCTVPMNRVKLFGLFFHWTQTTYTGTPVAIITQPSPATAPTHHTHITHTHTHDRLTVRDCPGEPVPEETFTHSHPCRGRKSIRTDDKLRCMEAHPIYGDASRSLTHSSSLVQGPVHHTQ